MASKLDIIEQLEGEEDEGATVYSTLSDLRHTV